MTWICLATGGYVGMSFDVRYRVMLLKRSQKSVQLLILSVLERHVIATFQFDTDRKIIAALTPAPLRHARVPGAPTTRHELQQFAVTTYQKMRGNL